MMGRGGAQPNEVLDIGGLLELVGDDQRYKGKLQELQAQVTEANRVRELALQTNMKAEENRRAVREMLEQAKAARSETFNLKQDSERLVAECSVRRREVEALMAQHNLHVDNFHQTVADTESKIAEREQACQLRELQAVATNEQAAKIYEQAKLNAAKLEKDTAEASQRVHDAINAAFAEAEHAKQEALRIKGVIAQKHSKYNEFVKSLATEQ